MYLEKFRCTPVQMGSWLAAGNAANVPAGFLWATVESIMIRNNVDTLSIRRRFEVATAGNAILTPLFAVRGGSRMNYTGVRDNNATARGGKGIGNTAEALLFLAYAFAPNPLV
jgi:hypothetical protein